MEATDDFPDEPIKIIRMRMGLPEENEAKEKKANKVEEVSHEMGQLSKNTPFCQRYSEDATNENSASATPRTPPMQSLRPSRPPPAAADGTALPMASKDPTNNARANDPGETDNGPEAHFLGGGF